MVRLEIQEHVGNDEIKDVGVLAGKIVEAMWQHKSVEIYTKEPISAIDIGLIDLVDELVGYFQWDPAKIKFTYGNHKESKLIDRYDMQVTDTGDPVAIYGVPDDFQHWNNTKLFGMFIGRLNVSRLHALEAFRKFKYKEDGLTSMHQAVDSDDINRNSLLTYLQESNVRWKDLVKHRPYSDIDDVLPTPILPPANFLGWGDVYKQIPLEIVCETSDSANNWQITEKLIRCIMYRRPFLLISSPGLARELSYESQMVRDLKLKAPLKLFQHLIPLNYDNLAGKERVTKVFSILHDLIKTEKIHSIIQYCNMDIDHNYMVMKDYLERGYNKDGLR